MATFSANPNEENEPWIEHSVFDAYQFRIWHLMFFCFSGFTILVVFICCCLKFRVPRTKLEIEGDYRRRKLAGKFKEKLAAIRNQDMDALDLQAVLKIIQKDFDEENLDIEKQLVLDGCHRDFEDDKKLDNNVEEAPKSKYAIKFANILALKINSPQISV